MLTEVFFEGGERLPYPNLIQIGKDFAKQDGGYIG